jgi:hypothetical protein
MITDALSSRQKKKVGSSAQHKYSLLFQHSAIPEDPTLTSKLLLNQSNITTSFGRWDSNLFTDGFQHLLTYSNNYMSTHMIAYYNHCGLALLNCQHHGYGVIQSCQSTQAHALVSLPGLPVQTPVLKPHPAVLICLDPYHLPRSHSALLTPLDPSVALPPTSPQALLMSTHPYHNTQGSWHIHFCTLTPLLWLLNILHRSPTHHSWHTETSALTALPRIMAITCSNPCLASISGVLVSSGDLLQVLLWTICMGALLHPINLNSVKNKKNMTVSFLLSFPSHLIMLPFLFNYHNAK